MVVILFSPLLEWWLFWCATFCRLVVNQDLHLNRIHCKTSSPCPFFVPILFHPISPRDIIPTPLWFTPLLWIRTRFDLVHVPQSFCIDVFLAVLAESCSALAIGRYRLASLCSCYTTLISLFWVIPLWVSLSLADNLNIHHGSMVVNIKNSCYTRVGVNSSNMQVNTYKSSQGNATLRVQNQSPHPSNQNVTMTINQHTTTPSQAVTLKRHKQNSDKTTPNANPHQ